MSVYRPKNRKGEFTSPFYHFDFRIGDHRFHGSTKSRTRREAEGVERQRRVAAKDELSRRAEKPNEKPLMTIDVACERFWNEKGKFYKGQAGKTFEASIWWLCDALGPDTPIRDIKSETIARLVARRRGEASLTRKTEKRLVSNATVNRTVLEPLRCILFRARDAWEEPIANIKWGVHRLHETEERVRELTADEERRLIEALPADYITIFSFALISGCRLAECVGLRWSKIDWGEREIEIHGKGDKDAKIPLTVAMRDLLFPLREHHPDVVFTYACRKKRGSRLVGDRLPITYNGLKTQWRRTIASAGITNFRFHDNRHTAATRLLRSGANLKLVQRLLRHTDIATTTKYAHVNGDDLRAAMEVAALRSTRTATPITGIPPEKRDASEKSDADKIAI